MTSAFFATLPEGPPWPELIEGCLVQEPPPGAAHQDAHSNLFLLLASHVAAHRLGKVYANPTGVWLSKHTVLEPDLIFLSTARRAQMQAYGIQGAPDLVVEILSPRSRRRDLRQKRVIYAAAGVPEYWIVAPAERLFVQLTAPAQGDYQMENVIVPPRALTSPLLPALKLPIDAVFK